VDMQDIKIYALNTSSLAISFTNLDTILKVILLLVSIGYTVNKWYLINKNKK
tara:strand:- start:6033 stop:6188 length:156 start_codon:yes stop_codon:yes gene_type:complete